MNHHDDFAALRNLLALKRLETPMDTEVNRFLIEFHRRQRAQLLVPESRWSRAVAWLKERAANLGMVPSLSYASALAAIALVRFSRPFPTGAGHRSGRPVQVLPVESQS